MNILVISHMFPNKEFDYLGVFVIEQVKALIQQGNEVIVIVPQPWIPFPFIFLKKKWKNYYNIPKQTVIEGIKVYNPRFPMIPTNKILHLMGYLYYFFSLNLIKRIYKDFKFDIVHAHSLLPDGFAATLLKTTFKVPVITTVHGSDIQSTIHNNNHCKKAVLKAVKQSDMVVFVSNKLKNILETIDNTVSEKKLSVINNGINFNKIKTINNNHLKEKYKDNIVLLSVANITKIKGHRFVIENLPELIKLYPNLKYIILGDGPGKKELVDQTNALNLNDKVEFLGVLNHNEVYNYIDICDIFVLPSYNEGFGVVYIEAMSLAKPTIGCKTQGIEDCITHMDTGFLVEPQNSKDVFNCIKYVLENNKESREIALKGQNLVKTKFTWEHNAKKYIDLYEKLIDSL